MFDKKILMAFMLLGISASAVAQNLLPEELTDLATVDETSPVKTIFLLEGDIVLATQSLNETNGSYTRDGWEVFDVSVYQQDGDFEGYIVTYKLPTSPLLSN